MTDTDKTITEKAIYDIKGFCMDIHRKYGNFMLEHAYRKILCLMLEEAGHHVDEELSLPIRVGEIIIHNAYRIDLLVDKAIVVELKAVKELLPVHHRQLHTYMQLGGYSNGLLINFGAENIFKDGICSYNTP